MSLLSVGSSGLAAAYAALNAASNNVANVNTPGYSRQAAVQTTMPGQFTGAGYVGRGVAVETIRRAFNDQVNGQVQFTQSQSSEAATQSQLMRPVDKLFASDDLGIGSAMDRFFSSLTEASSRPADMASRAAVISSAQQLVSRFNQTVGQLDELGRNSDLAVRATAAHINTLAQKIGSLNDAISISRASGQTANDLLDQRDYMIRQLNEQVGVTTLEQSDGSLNVFLSGGPALVVGSTASSLTIGYDPSVPQKQVVGVTTRNGSSSSSVQIAASNLNGGALTGQLKFREVNLVDAKNELGRLATALATTFNSVHQLGTNMNGSIGQPLFSLAPPQTFASSLNVGSGNISAAVTTGSSLQASDYRVDFDGSQYAVVRLQDGVRTTSATLPMTLDGLTISMTGTPSAGDSFQVQAVRNGGAAIGMALTDPRLLSFGQSAAAGDNRNALALAAVADQAALGGLTFSQAFGEVSAKVGTTTNGLHISAYVADKLLNQALADQSSVSGVNLDEEAAKLIRFQQAYQASAKVISTAQTIFQTLLDLGR